MANVGELSAKVSVDTRGSDVSLRNLGAASQSTERNLKGLGNTASITAGIISSQLITAIGTGLKNAFVGTSKDAQEFEASLTGVGRIAETFLGTSDEAIKLTERFGAVLGQVNAANAVKNLLAANFTIEETTALMTALTDAAAFNRQGTLAWGQAVEGATQGIKNGNSILVDNAGITKNLSVILEEAGLSATDLMNAASDVNVRMAIMNGLLKEAAPFAGDTEAAMTQLKGQMQLLHVETTKASVAFGNALNPVIAQAVGLIIPLVRNIGNFITHNKEGVQTALQLGFALGTTVVAVITAVKAFQLARIGLQLLSVQFTATQLAAGAFGLVMFALSAALAKSFADQMKTKSAAADLGDAMNSNVGVAGDMGNSLSKSGEKGREAMEKLAEAAEQTARKIRDIKDAIEAENEAFEQQVADIIKRRKESLENNKKNLDKETKEFERKQKENAENHKKTIQDIKEQNAQRLEDLETSLAKSVVVGSNTYEQDLQNYKAAIEEERLAGNQRLAEAEKEYKEETAIQKDEFKERTSALQVKIKEDESFLKKHREEVLMVNKMIQKDELEILKETHEKRIKDLNQQLVDERKAFSKKNADIRGDFNTALGGMGVDFDKLIGKMENQKIDMTDMFTVDWKKVFKGMIANLGAAVIDAFGFLTKQVMDIVQGVALEVAFQFNKILSEKLGVSFDLGAVNNLFENISKDIDIATEGLKATLRGKLGIPLKAAGDRNFQGGPAIVGEKGPELVVLPQNSKIIPNKEIVNNMGGNTYIFNQHIDKSIDVDAFNRGLRLQLDIL